jgi:chaperonin GroES
MLNDRVLIKRLPEATVTPGGIIIPESYQEKPMSGTVEAVGTGKLLDNGKRAVPDVKVGDEILFSKYTGLEIKLNGEEYLILSEGDILGVV